MTKDTDNNKNSPQGGAPRSDDSKIKSVKIDADSKRFVTMFDDIVSIFADDVRVLGDDTARICTLLIFKKHFKPKLVGATIEMDSIRHEEVWR